MVLETIELLLQAVTTFVPIPALASLGGVGAWFGGIRLLGLVALVATAATQRR